MKNFRTERVIPHLIRSNAQRDPDGLAIIDGARRLTFAEFDSCMVNAVQAMMDFGVKPGDRIAVWAPNSLEWLIAAMGVLGAGAILLPINNRLRGAEIANMLRRSSATALFTVDRFLGDRYPLMLREAAPDLAIPIIDLSCSDEPGMFNWRSMLERGAQNISRDLAADRIASISQDAVSDILYTSGTTGQPKGVVTTHGHTLHCVDEYIEILGLNSSDSLLLIPPLGLMFGLKYIFLLAVSVRATLVILPVFNPDVTMEMIATHGITYLAGPPTLLQDVLDSPNRTRYDLSSLRRILLAGTYIQPSLVLQIRDEGLADNVFVGYGLSEAAAVAMTRSDDEDGTAGTTVGRAMPGVKIRIANPDDKEVAIGEAGEILVNSPWLMNGYFDDPQQTEAAFTQGGWLRTGDIGSLDARGYLTILGRKKDMYIAGGFNVYPAEVETCLMQHGMVSRVAVVPMPDARLGEVGVAFVVPKQGSIVDSKALLRWAKTSLANYKVPHMVHILESLPMNASSKVLRDELRTLAREMAGLMAAPDLH
jgi:acyl-CoA synthetase (AMP-forming)/AMP-acid ligase II